MNGNQESFVSVVLEFYVGWLCDGERNRGWNQTDNQNERSALDKMPMIHFLESFRSKMNRNVFCVSFELDNLEFLTCWVFVFFFVLLLFVLFFVFFFFFLLSTWICSHCIHWFIAYSLIVYFFTLCFPKSLIIRQSFSWVFF